MDVRHLLARAKPPWLGIPPHNEFVGHGSRNRARQQPRMQSTAGRWNPRLGAMASTTEQRTGRKLPARSRRAREARVSSSESDPVLPSIRLQGGLTFLRNLNNTWIAYQEGGDEFAVLAKQFPRRQQSDQGSGTGVSWPPVH